MASRALKDFASSETGAVTVDWVVLTASIVGLGLATTTVVSGGMENLSGDIQASLASMQVGPESSDDAWEAGALLSWDQGFYDGMVDTWAQGGDVGNSVFGANEALGHAEAGTQDPAHQLDAAAAHITALNAMGEDTTELQTRYDAAYASYVSNNG
jgi:hypothetical protein